MNSSSLRCEGSKSTSKNYCVYCKDVSLDNPELKMSPVQFSKPNHKNIFVPLPCNNQEHSSLFTKLLVHVPKLIPTSKKQYLNI